MPAERIVTLLPSATEIVCELGLKDKLVGVTHECDYPAGVEALPHVTSSAIAPGLSSGDIDQAVRSHLTEQTALYSIDESLLTSLAPDLIVTQALCEVCAVSENDVLAVMQRLPASTKLVNLEPMTLGEVFDTVLLVGECSGYPERASRYVSDLKARVSTICEKTSQIPPANRPTVGFLEWLDPLFNAGHWTPEIIEMAGGVDAFGNKHQPSTTMADDKLFESDPDVLIVALCGFDEARARADLEAFSARVPWHDLKAVKQDRVHILDGNALFSRPGPRLVDSLEILTNLLHP